jgi:hypothetical protein
MKDAKRDGTEYFSRTPVSQEDPLERADGQGCVPGRVTLFSTIYDARERLPGIGPEAIKHGGLMHARDGAERGAAFRFGGFPDEIRARVLLKRNGGTASLLGAVMDQPVLTDV